MCWPRQSAICSSFNWRMGVPATITSPSVGWSMPVNMLISVDLPLPDLPTTATNSPACTVRSTPFNATKGPAAVSYALTIPRRSITPLASALPKSLAVRLARRLENTKLTRLLLDHKELKIARN